MAAGPTVTILMGVFDGAAHLRAQLDSLAAQDHADWRLIASDDGSRDGSLAILEAFAAGRPAGQVACTSGPGRGFAANYLSLLAGLSDDPGWVAFSDQDDVWLPDRLTRGLHALPAGNAPALYCSRTWVTAADLSDRRLSPLFRRPPSFRNALVQNVAAGNTILLNPAAARLLVATARRVRGIVAHDWWAYLAVTGAGGQVVMGAAPTLLYRQHGANAIGSNSGWGARLRRLAQVWRGGLGDWNDTNAAALTACADLLTPAARGVLADWQRLRASRPAPLRLWRLWRLRLYRQTPASAAVLWLAAAIGRI